MLRILYILSWIIFVGICIETGGIMFNAIYWLASKSVTAKYLWEKIDLSNLYNRDRGYFLVITLIMSIVGVLKACIFYLIIKVLHDKKLNMTQPFNNEVGRFIFTVSYLVILIGAFSVSAGNYSDWLVKRSVAMPSLQDLGLAGADIWFFMGVTLYVIAHIFKRGIEIQAENDLTI